MQGYYDVQEHTSDGSRMSEAIVWGAHAIGDHNSEEHAVMLRHGRRRHIKKQKILHPLVSAPRGLGTVSRAENRMLAKYHLRMCQLFSKARSLHLALDASRVGGQDTGFSCIE